MATPTYTPLATITLTGNDSAIVFSNIPQTYRDLVVIVNPLSNQLQDITVSLNGSTSDFTGVRMYGFSGGTASNTYSNSLGIGYMDITSGRNFILNIMDYSATDKHKTILGRQNRGSDFTSATVHRWASTAAITSIGFNAPSPYVWVSGATFSLYGIEA